MKRSSSSSVLWELVGCCVMYFLTKFLSNQSQYVMLDGCRSKLVNVVSRVHQGIILGLELFLLYTVEAFSIVKNNLYAFADYFTLVAVVPFPGDRVTVTESLNCNLIRVSMWCDLWGIKLNASKTKTMTMMSLQLAQNSFLSIPLTLDGTVLNSLRYKI